MAPAGSSSSGSEPISLEHLVQYLATTGQTQEDLNQTLRTFSTKETREVILASKLPSGQDPLEILDAQNNTLGYLYILSARMTFPNAPPPPLPLIEAFCKDFNPEHARLAPDRVTALAKAMVQAAGENLKLILGPLRDLATRYPPTPSHLTTLHPIFLTACVTTRHFATALPILSSPIFNIDTSLSELSYNDNLIYHYAGGVAFGALKRWREAEEFLEICVTAPGQIPAAIQLEALKKLTLVQLILYGKATAPPKYTNPTLIRMLKNTSYHTLAKAYPQTISSLTATVYRDIDIFKAEQNLGLVQQVIQRAPRWLIRRLTLTYLTLGLGDIAKEVGIESEEEVRAVVVSMVESEDINASISVDGTVTFTTSTAQFSKAEIDKAVAQAQAQSQLLQELERTMNSSKEYLVKAIKHKDDAWGPDEDVMFNTHPGGSSWADENLYS